MRFLHGKKNGKREPLGEKFSLATSNSTIRQWAVAGEAVQVQVPPSLPPFSGYTLRRVASSVVLDDQNSR